MPAITEINRCPLEHYSIKPDQIRAEQTVLLLNGWEATKVRSMILLLPNLSPGCLPNSPLIGAKKNPMLTSHYSLALITAAASSVRPVAM